MKQTWNTEINRFTCDGCGVEYCAATAQGFHNKRYNRKQGREIYCSRACSDKYQARGAATRPHWSTKYEPLTCAQCGSIYYRTTSQAHGSAKRWETNYCSAQCQEQGYKSGKHGALVTRGLVGPDRAEELAIAKQYGRTQCPVYVRRCRYCDTLTTFRVRSRRYCSDECRRLKNIERITDLYAAVTGKASMNLPWRRILVEQLRHRDGDTCLLCAQPIDFTVKSGPLGSDHGYSIEHVIPRSQHPHPEWADSYYNLALSHWGCNRTRRVTPLLQARRELCGLGP